MLHTFAISWFEIKLVYSGLILRIFLTGYISPLNQSTHPSKKIPHFQPYCISPPQFLVLNIKFSSSVHFQNLAAYLFLIPIQNLLAFLTTLLGRQLSSV
jgi:hypothetical protein